MRNARSLGLLAMMVVLYFSATEAGAIPIEVHFSMHWGTPQPIPLFGVDEPETLSFSAFVDTNDVADVVPAGSAFNNRFNYGRDIFLFSAGDVRLSEVLYGSKLWTEASLSLIGYGSDGMQKEGVLAIEGGLDHTTFTNAAIRFVDSDGRLDFNTSMSLVGSDVVIMGRSGSTGNSQRTAFSFLRGQSLQLSAIPVPAPPALPLFLLGLFGLGFLHLRKGRKALANVWRPRHYRSAASLVCEYGEAAALETPQRADAMLDKGDLEEQRVWLRIVALVIACVAGAATTVFTTSVARAELIVSSFGSNSVLAYDEQTGVFSRELVSPGSGGLAGPAGNTFGPDGNLYVSSVRSDEVLRYNGVTGEFIDVFATRSGLSPAGIEFGPDGNLYVVSGAEVLRFDGGTGTFIDAFVPSGLGGIRVAVDLEFGPDGNLYLSVQLDNNGVLRYDGATGAFIDVFASGTILGFPTSFQFGHDADLYVNSITNDTVERFDGTSGAFIETFASGTGLDETSGDNAGLVFGRDGNLYISNSRSNNVAKFDGSDGSFLDFFIPSGLGGISNPTWLSFSPETISVPEPASFHLFGPGLICLGMVAWLRDRRRSRAKRS